MRFIRRRPTSRAGRQLLCNKSAQRTAGGSACDAWSARRNLDELRQLRLGQLGFGEFKRDRVLDDRIQSHDFVGDDGSFWEEVVARAPGLLDADVKPLGIEI